MYALRSMYVIICTTIMKTDMWVLTTVREIRNIQTPMNTDIITVSFEALVLVAVRQDWRVLRS